MPVFSRGLGVNGLCDCVEARPSPTGVPIPYGEGRYIFYPVEYKHGVVRDEEEYHLQLCAQAICLEERFGVQIPAVYSAKCKKCSLRDTCQPQMKRSSKLYRDSLWDEVVKEIE